jgi:hypothetical protein
MTNPQWLRPAHRSIGGALLEFDGTWEGLTMNHGSASVFKRRLERRHPYLLVEYWKEGERPFNWFAEWERLYLEVTNIRVSISHQQLTRKFGDDQLSVSLEQVDEKVLPPSLPDDQKKPYLDYVSHLFNETFTKADTAKALTVSGTFNTESHRSVGFIRPGEAEKPAEIQKGHIALYSSDDIQRGYLWSVNEDEANWNTSQKVGDVCVNLYLPPAQINEAITEIKQAVLGSRQVRVGVDVYVLAFQSDVERSLAEPWHSEVVPLPDTAG